MGAKRTGTTLPTTLPFETFWRYLEAHPNCILRAGTPEATLYDDEDLHWHFATEHDGTQVVELIRGKKLVADLAVVPPEVAYVEVTPEGDKDEWRFDLISEADKERVAVAFFVMSHAYEGDQPSPPDGGPWTH